MGKKSKRRAGRQRQQQRQQRREEEGQHLVTTDRFIEQFNLISSLHDDPWHAERVSVFYAYSRILMDHLEEWKEKKDGDFCTKADRKFLKMIRLSEVEPAFFRVVAYYFSGMDYFFRGYDVYGHDALQHLDDGIAICDSASDEEKERTVDIFGSSVKVGALLAEYRRKCMFMGALNDSFTLGAWDQDGNDVAVSIIPGLECDCCGKSRDELGVTRLSVCSFCQMAYYCSADCQLKAWKEKGHKKVCRKQGEFRVGDGAFTLEAFGNVSNGSCVQIIAPAPEDPMQENLAKAWVVKSKKFDETGIVPVGRLKRMRPAMWDGWGIEEIEMVKEMLLASEAKDDTHRSGGESEDGEEVMPDLVARGWGVAAADDDDEEEG